jgi:hypothetical protein
MTSTGLVATAIGIRAELSGIQLALCRDSKSTALKGVTFAITSHHPDDAKPVRRGRYPRFFACIARALEDLNKT